MCRVLGSPGNSWWPYGGADWTMFSLWTLLRNMPPREEALEACSASKVVRTLRDMTPVRRGALKTLFLLGFLFLMPFLGTLYVLVFSFLALFKGLRINPFRALKMALFRVDMFMYPVLEDWQRGKGAIDTLSQAIIHFSDVDIYRMYSLFIRAAHHLIDVYNKPEHGKVQDKLTFYAMCKDLGLPCAAPLTPEDIKKLRQKDLPLFMKPSNEQEAVGAKVIDTLDDPDLQRAVDKPEDWVVQKKLRNCDFLRQYFPKNPPLCGVRITTVMTKTGPEILESWIRVGAENAVADCPFSAGGSEFAIFAETGVVWQGSSEKQMKLGDTRFEPSLTVANGAKVPIGGVKIPNWEKSLEMCKKAHTMMAKDAFTIGWDVAHTPEGPLMVEANLISNVGCFMGLRYGAMAQLWPRVPLMWLDIAQWMEGKADFPNTPRKVKISSIKSVIKESEWLLKKASDAKNKIEERLKATKAADPEKQDNASACLKKLQTDLFLRTGEMRGLELELENLRKLLEELISMKKAPSHQSIEPSGPSPPKK
jgi:hypothetical protein